MRTGPVIPAKRWSGFFKRLDERVRDVADVGAGTGALTSTLVSLGLARHGLRR